MVRKNRPLGIFRGCDEAKSSPFHLPSNACHGDILSKSLLVEKRQYRQCITLMFLFRIVEHTTRPFFYSHCRKIHRNPLSSIDGNAFKGLSRLEDL